MAGRTTRTLLMASLGMMIATSASFAPAYAQAGTTSFQIFIPAKDGGFNHAPAPYPEIGQVKATVSVFSGMRPVNFTITDDQHNQNTLTFMNLLPNGGTTPTQSFTASLTSDSAYVVANADATNPQYDIYLILRSDSDPNSCLSQMQGPRSYTVSVGASDPKITAACLESFDAYNRGQAFLANCSNASLHTYVIPNPVDTSNDTVAGLQSGQTPPACSAQRPPVDVVMVLDKSGSMASVDLGTTSRMDALHQAVTSFVNVWGNLPPAAGDSLGFVSFDTGVHQVFPLGAITDPNIITDVTNTQPGGSTSIGAGLLQADSMLPVTGHRRVALLMSDGQQNTDPLVQNTTGAVSTFCLSNPALCNGMLNTPVALPNQSIHPYQIYTVTLGPSASETINQTIANNSGGFYLNTEDLGQANLLNPFFLELLQNFVRFNSYETVRLVSAATPYSATVPISTTSHDLVLSLMWQPQRGPLRLTLTPPGGAAPIVRESASGFISVVENLPLQRPYDPRGDWKIQVEASSPAGAPVGIISAPGAVPFDLHAMTDDAGIKTELGVVPGDYKPGDKIRLRAKLTQFGRPILGLGTHSGDKIEVQLLRPGKSIGDILSESTASAVSPDPADPDSPAEAKLANTLKNNPNVLKRNCDTAQLFNVSKSGCDTVQLYDDGKPEHGDDVAGDGIYSALYPATLPGHYNFLFAVESVDANAVRFSREQLRTAYVRPFPEAGKIGFQSSVSSSGASKTLTIVMTPRTHAGDRMGPGWGPFFWFQAAGQTPFKGKDNLDGTYTATLSFTGSKPPKVSLGFVTAVVYIGDSVTYNQLPAPPTTLVDSIPANHNDRIALFLDAGAGIPQGTFSNAFNTGFSFNAGLEFMVASHLSLEGIFGYHNFPPNVGSNLKIYQYSANAKVYLNAPQNKIRPFVNGGVGGYTFSPGSTNFGGNAGGGLLFNLTARFGLQASYNFHAVNTPVAATQFSSVQGGVRFVF